MSDLIAIVSIICSAIVIVVSVYFNWKKLKLEEKMLRTKTALILFPELKDKAIAMGIKYSNNIPAEMDIKSLDELQEATFKFQDNWWKKKQKKKSKKSNN